MGFRKSLALPLITAILLVFFQSAVMFARAEEIAVSGNGSGSVNEVSVQNIQTTTITQTNNADVTNNVDTSADTGGNTANGNTGSDVGITTGDASQNIEIENSLNFSSVDVPCCPSDISAEISGNGSDSTNEIAIGSETQTNISITQNANVENNVSGSANTGDNSANDNTGGSVLIDTGSIWVAGGIKNGPINVYSITGGSGGQDVSVSVSGNGSGSTNLISLLLTDLANLNVQNNANIVNDVSWDLNTGRNEANGNTGGDVEIRTGDIFFDFSIENGPINVGGIDWGCCPDGDGDGDPPPPPPGDGDGDGDGDGAGPGPSGAGDPGAGGFVLALAETSGEAYPMILFGLAMIAAGASLVKKRGFR